MRAQHFSIRDKSTFMLVCRAGAKINLTLEVLSRRSDGYHLLKSVVHSIGLWDTLHFECGVSPGFSLRSNWPELMTDNNLCLRAARAWTETASAKSPQRFGGVRITLEKTIPMGSGLGGGSSNAAATLLALNEYHQHLLEPEELAQIALKLGADVPFFLQGGCALMEGIGEKLTPLPLVNAWAVLICPPHHAGTADIFRAFDQNSKNSPLNTSPSEALMEHLAGGDLHAMKNFLHNDLQNAAASNGIDSTPLINILLENGAHGASMSGSGSAVFGLFATIDDAEPAQGKIREKLGQKFHVHAVPLTSTSYVPFPPATR